MNEMMQEIIDSKEREDIEKKYKRTESFALAMIDQYYSKHYIDKEWELVNYALGLLKETTP
jgi:hypothetical protein